MPILKTADAKAGGDTFADDEITVDTMPFDEREQNNTSKKGQKDRDDTMIATSNDSNPMWYDNILVVDDSNDFSDTVANDFHVEKDIVTKMEQLVVEDKVVPFEPFVSKPWEDRNGARKEVVQINEVKKSILDTIVVEPSPGILSEQSKEVKDQSKGSKYGARKGNSTPRRTLSLLGSILASNEETNTLAKGDEGKRSVAPSMTSRNEVMPPAKSLGNGAKPTPERSASSGLPSRPTPERSVAKAPSVTGSKANSVKPSPEIGASRSGFICRNPTNNGAKGCTDSTSNTGSTGKEDIKWDACLSSKYARDFYLKKQKSVETKHLPPLASHNVSATPIEESAALSNGSLKQVKVYIGQGSDFETGAMQKHQNRHSDASVISDITYDDKISLASTSTNRLMMTRASRKSSKGRQEKKAATVIQSAIRRKLALAEAKKRKDAPIVCIQALFRGVATRRALDTLSSNAVLIQTVWRVNFAHKRFLQTKLDKLENNSAIKIQARLRTYTAMRNYVQLRVQVVTIQSICRMYAAQKYANNIRTAQKAMKKYIAAIEAVTSLQACARMQLAREKFQTTLGATVQIQAWSRRMLVQREYEAVRQSVVKMQALARRNKVQENHLATIRAAVKLQTNFRRISAQQVYQKQRSSAILLQSAFRTALAVGAYKAELKALSILQNVASLAIQKVWRGHLARVQYAATQKKAGNTASLRSCWTRFALGEDFLALSDVDLLGTFENDERRHGGIVDSTAEIENPVADAVPEEAEKSMEPVPSAVPVENEFSATDPCSGEEIECIFNTDDTVTATMTYSVASIDEAFISRRKSEDFAHTHQNEAEIADEGIEVDFTSFASVMAVEHDDGGGGGGDDGDCTRTGSHVGAIENGLSTAPSCEAYEVIFDEDRQKCVIASLKPKADDMSSSSHRSSTGTPTTSKKDKLYINRRSGKIVRKVKRSEKDKMAAVVPRSKEETEATRSGAFPSLPFSSLNDMMTSIDDYYEAAFNKITASCGVRTSE